MPIPFHDEETIEELGLAAFLHMETQGGKNAGEVLFGGLLMLNARGEPLEFVFNRLELLSDVLWRPADRAPAAQRRLAATLFAAATLSPSFLLLSAATIAPRVFGPKGQIALTVPVGRVGCAGMTPREDETVVSVETFDAAGEAQTIQVWWSPPPPGAAAACLFALLAERGLLLEPFERAAAGLREVYGEPLGSMVG